MIIYGSTIILKLMTRFPVIITVGAALLGWVAGEMAVSDPSIAAWSDAHHSIHTIAPILGAVLVVVAGRWLASRGGGDGTGTAGTPA